MLLSQDDANWQHVFSCVLNYRVCTALLNLFYYIHVCVGCGCVEKYGARRHSLSCSTLEMVLCVVGLNISLVEFNYPLVVVGWLRFALDAEYCVQFYNELVVNSQCFLESLKYIYI